MFPIRGIYSTHAHKVTSVCTCLRHNGIMLVSNMGGELTFTVANRGGISSASRCSSGGESESMANTVSLSFGIGSFVRLDITLATVTTHKFCFLSE